MKTINIYSFSELSEKAQQTAIENYRNENYDQPINWADELLESLKGVFENCNGIKLKDYRLGEYNSSIDVEFSQNEARYLSGKRAFAWIENNLLSNIRIPFYGEKRKELRKYGNSYYAGQIKPCPFTGYCADEDFLDSILTDLKKNCDLRTIFECLAIVYQKRLRAEIEYQNSDEYISEMLEANDYNFTIDGKII